MTSAIAAIVQHYYPDWEPPGDRRRWNPCLCPAHDEDRPSCSVNHEAGAIVCKACGFKGDTVSIVMRKEGLRYADALRVAETIAGRCDIPVSSKPAGKPGRRAFGGAGDSGPGKPVLPRVRRGPAPWA